MESCPGLIVDFASQGVVALNQGLFKHRAYLGSQSPYLGMAFSAHSLYNLLMETSCYLGPQRDMSLMSELVFYGFPIFSPSSAWVRNPFLFRTQCDARDTELVLVSV